MSISSFSLRSTVERALARANVPGCSIALVDASGLRWSGGFGLADVRSGRPATADTVYRLFSGTKLFTAVAVLQLAERGLLDLDDRVGRWLPELAAARDVTLQQLLSHRSGLADGLRGFLAVSWPEDEPPTSAEALARYPIRRVRAPGTKVEYRNVNYAILGEVISRVTGVEYREHVARAVLAPLGMRAGFGLTGETRPQAATGHIGRWDPMRLVLRALFPGLPARLYGARVEGPRGSLVELREYDLGTAAIGGLVGSMPELAKFLSGQLAGGGEILGEASTRRMQTLVAEGAAGIESRVGVGLGWKIGRTAERAFINHEGGGAGFTSELRIYPDVGLGVALGMNMMRMPHTMRAAHAICEAVLAAREALFAADPAAPPARPRDGDRA